MSRRSENKKADRDLLWVLNKIFDFLASIELAVFIIIAIAAISAAGTIFEAKYDREVAYAVVYRSFWFTAVLVLFMLNLLFAALSRLPWKRHHIGFLITHLGLIILLIGSVITAVSGVDGSIALGEGETQNSVRLEENYLHLWRAIPGKNYDRMLSQKLNYNRVSGFPGEKTWQFPLTDIDGKTTEKVAKLSIQDWWPFATRHVGVRKDPTGKTGVPAIHLRLMGSRANIDQWLFLNGVQGSQIDLGPARIEFVNKVPLLLEPRQKRTLFIYLREGDDFPYLAQVDAGSLRVQELGPAKTESRVPLGWMDFEFLTEEFHLKAIPSTTYTRSTATDKSAVEVVKVALNGEERWLEMGAAAQILWDQYLFYVQFTKKQIQLGFPIRLQKFKIDFYEGSTRPMSYESLVSVDNSDEKILIQMNEPLHHKGFTFYQSSYSTDQDGRPVISVLSVNRDPGRWTKYAGCIMLVLGILLMFYFRPVYSGKSKWFIKRSPEAQA